jgi:ankyrin repeat protein
VDTLLKKGANTVIRPDLNMTALHCAAMAQYESLAIAKLLVEHKCPVNLKSTQAGETPLFLAINSGYSELVEYLLSLGVDANDSSPVSRTCFQQAIFRGHKDIVVLLLGKGGYRLTDEDRNDLNLYIMDLYQDNDVEMIAHFIDTSLVTKEKVLECIENYHKWQSKQIAEQQGGELAPNNGENGAIAAVAGAGSSAESADERDRLMSPNDLRIDFDAAGRMIYPNTVEELDVYLNSKMHLQEPSHLSDDE